MARLGFEKQDRVLRLLREVTLFQAVPYGLTSVQLAERMEPGAVAGEDGRPFMQDGEGGCFPAVFVIA